MKENEKSYIIDEDQSLFMTKGYLAPDVYESREYTFSSDIYALGCTIYTLFFINMNSDPKYKDKNVIDFSFE